jgi:hypothetical protein
VIDCRDFCKSLEDRLWVLFNDFRSGISAREDSRAFGAMIERRITDAWRDICLDLGTEFLPQPGRRTIYDFACGFEGAIIGLDVKTKDLDSTRYSDGGVCAVGNMLKFLANDKGVFTVVEFGHTNAVVGESMRDLDYIKVAPFHLLPEDAYRIENLGTGQVRLNYSINQVFDEMRWNRSLVEFFDIFIELAVHHYERVGRDAGKRADAMRTFKANGYKRFSF